MAEAHNNHNLDDVDEYIEFTLNNNQYRMRYPTSEEIMNADSLADKDEQRAFMYSFVEPVTEGAPPIAEALGKANIMKTVRFNQMIAAQFGETGL